MEKKVLKVLSGQLNEKMPNHQKGKINISFAADVNYQALFKDYKLTYEDQGKRFNLEDVGSGIQSLTIIAMYRYLAHLKHKRFILGIEEPETNLHPQSQRALINEIVNATDEGFDGDIQLVFTSHSIPIVDQLPHHQVVLIKRNDCSRRGFFSSANQVKSTFFADHNLKNEAEYKSLRFNNSEFHFARHVFIVEGETDVALVNTIAESQNIDLNAAGISILSLSGKSNFFYPYYLLNTLRIPFTFICDKDFFLLYENDSYKESIQGGLLRYQPRYTREAIRLLNYLQYQDLQRQYLQISLQTNHQHALQLLSNHNIICYRSTLEIDLLNSTKGYKLICDSLKLDDKTADKDELLKNKTLMRKLKKPEKIQFILKQLPQASYPYSFKYIRDALKSKSQYA